MSHNRYSLVKKLFLGGFILTLLFSSAPQKAEAQYVDVFQLGKEGFGDFIAYNISQIILKKITAKTVNWINSGFQGNPSYVTDPKQFFLDVGDETASAFLSGTNLNRLCAPFKAEVRLALVKNYLSETSNQNYTCTLDKLKTNYNEFMNDFSKGGWEGWFEITQNSQNNPYGSYFNAQQSLSVRVSGAGEEKRTQLTQSGGFLSFEKCKAEFKVKNEIDAYTWASEDGTDMYKIGACRKVANAREVVTPGSVINGQLTKSLGSSWARLEAADEITEIVTALVGQLIEKVVGGSGDGGLRGASRPSPGSSSSFIDDYLNDPSPRPININPPTQDTFTCTTDPSSGIMRCRIGNSPPTGPVAQCSFVPGNGAPNMSYVVAEVASDYPQELANSCQQEGGTSEFIDRVVRKLHAIDPRWGWNGKRGNANDLSQDAIAYYYGSETSVSTGNTSVYIIDIISSVCPSGNPGAAWTDVTKETLEGGTTGAYVYPRNGGGTVAVRPNSDTGPSCRPISTGGGRCTFSPSSFGNSRSPEAPSTIDASEVIFEDNSEVGGWDETVKLESFRVDSTNIYLSFNKTIEWPNSYLVDQATNANPWIIIWRDGAWRATTFSWLRPGQVVKEATHDIYFGGGGGAQTFRNFKPVAGERYGFMVSGIARAGVANNIEERSNIVMYTWPSIPDPVCSSNSDDPGNPENPNPPINPNPGTAFITSVTPNSAKPGVTTVTIVGTDLTNQVSFFDGAGERQSVVGSINTEKTRVTALVPDLPIGNATVKIYRGRDSNNEMLFSNGKLIAISNEGGTGAIPTVAPTNIFTPTGIEMIGYLGRTYNNGWWPTLSPNGRYVAFGNFGDSFVIDLNSTSTPKQMWNFKAPAGFPSEAEGGGRCMGGQWLSNTKLTFVCEIGGVVNNNVAGFWRYEVTVGEWIARKTSDDPNNVISTQWRAKDNVFASFAAGNSRSGTPSRITLNNQVVATNTGGAISISGSKLVHACTNDNTSICVRTGLTLTKTYPVRTPMAGTATLNDYIAYGGYGPIRGITPTGVDIDLTVTPWKWENLGELLWVNGTMWVVTTSFDSSSEGTYIFLRPWGSKPVIAVSAPAVWVSVVVKGSDFLIAYNDAVGNMQVLTIPINSQRITLN